MLIKSGENSLPLLSHHSHTEIVSYRQGQAISVSHFLKDAGRVAATLHSQSHVLNTCQDRYRFAVGLAATMMSKTICLMPPTLAPEMLRKLASITPGFATLDDTAVEAAIRTPEQHSDAETFAPVIPMIPADQLAALVFTSGSTGTPLPHPKTWGFLVNNVSIEARRLGLTDGRRHTIIGTVPPQHMYGFESTVLVALQSGNAFHSGRPFYPADICTAIDEVPLPRLLVSTPIHLKSLITAGMKIPQVNIVVSATAPLSPQLARETEAMLQARILEIYGCTETGQIASRYSTDSAEWELFDKIQMHQEGDQTWVSGGHVEVPVALQDIIEITRPGRFLLHGRSADMINIAGKRTSLAYLNHQLNEIPGVIDGTFFMPEENEERVTRLAAFVVAPELDAESISLALRELIDPAFLPRPIHLVDTLPRNSTGKLPRDALLSLEKGLPDKQHR